MIRFVKTKDYNDMSRKAANIISAQVILKPDSVLGLATGSSPIGTYKQLIDWYNKGDIDFSNVTAVNLDEYKGLSKDNEQSYHYFMFNNFYNHINIRKENCYLPDGENNNTEEECKRYDSVIENTNGIDLQLLGIGHNGHIGFNEPSDSFDKGTHCVSLSERTIQANKRFFDSIDEVPKQAYTMGIITIMSARKIVVVVYGKDKANIVKEAFFGPITPKVPASILQLHRDVTIVGDEEAFSLCDL